MKSLLFYLSIILSVSLLAADVSSSQWIQTMGPVGGNIRSLAVSGSTVYAGTRIAGLFRSTDNGTTWAPFALSGNILVNSLAVDGTDLYAGVTSGSGNGMGLFRYSGTEGKWYPAESGLPSDGTVTSVRVIGSRIFAGTYSGVYVSTDKGKTWTAKNAGLTGYGMYPNDFAATGQSIFAATNGGVYRSNDNGTTWSTASSEIGPYGTVGALIVAGADIFAGVSYKGIYRSSDLGNTWSLMNSGLPDTYFEITSFSVAGGALFVATSEGVYRSSDKGANWIQVNAGLTTTTVKSMVSNGTDLFAGTFGGGVFRSSNTGTTWDRSSTGIVNSTITAMTTVGDVTLAGIRGGGIFRSVDKGASWTYAGAPNTYPNAFLACGNDLFAAADHGLYRSTDKGQSWFLIDTSLATIQFSSLAASSDSILYAGAYGGVYVSKDKGRTWAASNTGLTTTYVSAVAVMGGKVFAGTQEEVFVSYNGGASWSRIVSYIWAWAFAVSGDTLFIGTAGEGVALIKENGQAWSVTRLGLGRTRSLAVAGKKLYVGTEMGVYSAAIDDGKWNWGWDGEYNTIYGLAASATDLYIGTDGYGVLRLPLPAIPSGVDGSPGLPEGFQLAQNYPNPFNPSTTISFSIARRSMVSLKIFDAMGRDVATVVSGELPPGTYAPQWNADGQPSGVYFYQLRAGTYNETRRLVLLR